MKQVALQISLKRNPIESVLLLRNREGVSRLEVFAVGGYHANAAQTRAHGGKQQVLNVSLTKE